MSKPVFSLAILVLFGAVPALAETCWTISDNSYRGQGVPDRICASAIEVVSAERGCRSVDGYDFETIIDGKRQNVALRENKWGYSTVVLAHGGDDDPDNPGGYTWSVNGRVNWTRDVGAGTHEIESVWLDLSFQPHARESSWANEPFGFTQSYKKQ